MTASQQILCINQRVYSQSNPSEPAIMKVLLVFGLLVVGLSNTGAFFFSPPSTWNGLRVTWGMNIFSSYTFDTMPRTVQAAEAQGFVKISSCGDNPKFLGNRYTLNGDYSVTLIFDVNGYIAGIQAGFLKSRTNTMVRSSSHRVFNEEDDRYVLTAYFVDPAIICGQGRNRLSETGTGLYIQNGTDPIRDSIEIPKQQSAIDRTRWTKGKCFYSMGLHYWYNLTSNMDCTDFFPVFLMYNEHKLNSFGWAFAADLTSPRFEHPTPRAFSMFLKPVPNCLRRMGTISTMHIYLTNSPIRNTC